jgi:hypothetical protein
MDANDRRPLVALLVFSALLIASVLIGYLHAAGVL